MDTQLLISGAFSPLPRTLPGSLLHPACGPTGHLCPGPLTPFLSVSLSSFGGDLHAPGLGSSLSVGRSPAPTCSEPRAVDCGKRPPRVSCPPSWGSPSRGGWAQVPRALKTGFPPAPQPHVQGCGASCGPSMPSTLDGLVPEGGWLQKAGFHVDRLWRRLDGAETRAEAGGQGKGEVEGNFPGQWKCPLSQ